MPPSPVLLRFVEIRTQRTLWVRPADIDFIVQRRGKKPGTKIMLMNGYEYLVEGNPDYVAERWMRGLTP